MKQSRINLSITLVYLLLFSQSVFSNTQPNLGNVIWSAFVCSEYAGIYGNRNEQKRLFEVGFQVGREFINGIKNKTIPDSEAENTPIGILMRLSGPTTDFAIGRIFEGASGSAHDKVTKEDRDGLPITDPLKWADKELKTIYE
ncbi:MAG: hypothetical protein DIZ80_13105 [endosymbiont of Galathealinum brachiosum]|uniref:Uncharacterized protein n=1 Tax=endosymbiont of Galathealinum brachiosum TaxID=2200906 RepID=A0A370D800_9GAMM|nr:MAG: hypothetical protein DIZ80_13105 [endosymbiont of Galathealinum brachiosum]